LREYVREAYREARGVSEPVRQRGAPPNDPGCAWTVLGVGTAARPQPYTSFRPPVACARGPPSTIVSITTQSFEMVLHGSPSSPFAIAPALLDGLYLSRTQLVQVLFEPWPDHRAKLRRPRGRGQQRRLLVDWQDACLGRPLRSCAYRMHHGDADDVDAADLGVFIVDVRTGWCGWPSTSVSLHAK